MSRLPKARYAVGVGIVVAILVFLFVYVVPRLNP